MTGLLLLSANGMYATPTGNVSWGPKSDKAWVREMIKDQIVFVGQKTFASISKFERLIALPERWEIGTPTPDCTIHFGGPKSMNAYPPARLIIHRTKFDIPAGLKFEPTFGLRLVYKVEKKDYWKEVYDVKE